ncbi:hypothetical protein TNCV_1476961 [Trichonephila clavipes]|nr:hypothetical protein TNCV_1476961 [Trichonephila clavipes]
MVAVVFQSCPSRAPLVRDLVTWQATGVRHILKYIVGKITHCTYVGQLTPKSFPATTGCLESGKWHRTNSSDDVEEDMVIA